jgi:hypothetical protein
VSWLLVPLDDRPCCWRFPQQLAPVQVPPREILGRFQQPGDSEAVLQWLRAKAPSAQGCLLSLDMISWGGLVGSRQAQRSLPAARERLGRLADIPGRKLAYQTILRNAPTQTTADEMHWAELLVQLSESLGEDERLRTQIPETVLSSYLATRARNAELYSFVRELDLEYLLFALDDSRTRGWNLQELQSLGDVPNIPGTDETALLLMIRALAPGHAIALNWCDDAVKSYQGAYEDRPLVELVGAQLRAASLQVNQAATQQLWIYGRVSGPQPEARWQTPGYVNEEWLERLVHTLDQGSEVVLVDVSFANGGDLSLARALLDRGLWARLRGYAAWNTLGNRVGTGLANLVLPVPDAAQFLLERICDDLLYQARFRWDAAELLGHPGLQLTETELAVVSAEVFPRLLEELQPYAEQVGRSPDLVLSLPWSRLFEVEITALNCTRNG